MTVQRAPDELVREANERDLSTAEYCRRMIRAGRRQFGHDYDPAETPANPKTLKLDNTNKSDIEAQLKTWIHANLSSDEALDVEDLSDLLEDELAVLADELCDEGKAKYRRSKGGYLKIIDE